MDHFHPLYKQEEQNLLEDWQLYEQMCTEKAGSQLCQ